MASRDCVLFLTHRWSPSIAVHYGRLKRQAGSMLDVLLVYHTPSNGAAPDGANPDVVVTTDEIAAAFPRRFAERGDRWAFYCADLIWMTAAVKAPVSGYDRVWVLEYDVDFSGDWATFFRDAVHYEGDLLGTDIRPLSVTPGWWNAEGYRQPEPVPEDPIIGFFPIVRVSKALVGAYHRHLDADGWNGHFEMVLPSFAAAKGFSISEIGGDGAFTPPGQRGRHYTTPRMVGSPAATFSFRPPRSFRYFATSARPFRKADHLYHPVKSDLPIGDRLRFQWKRLGHRWVRLRNRLLRRG